MDSSLEGYAVSRVNDLHTCGARHVDVQSEDVGDEILIMARLTFGERDLVLMEIFEAVRMETDGRPHRRKYSYHVMAPGGLGWRYDRDAVSHPNMPEHKHTSDNRRIPWERVTFRDTVDEIHDLVRQIESEHLGQEDD